MIEKIAKRFTPSNKLSEKDQNAFSDKQYFSSFTSLSVFSALLFSAGIVLLFLWNFPIQSPEYYKAHPGLLYRNYLYVILLATQILYLLYFLTVSRKNLKQLSELGKIITVGETYFFLYWAAALSSVDQLIHGDISAYLLACFAIAAVVKLYPWQFFLGYASSLLIFLIGVTQFQADPARLSAHYVNGPIMVIMALITSLLMYRMVLRAFVYRTTIQKQKDEMELRVYERTADLALANEELKEEIAERKAAEEKMRYLRLLHNSKKHVL